jgi:hypothetical protein
MADTPLTDYEDAYADCGRSDIGKRIRENASRNAGGQPRNWQEEISGGPRSREDSEAGISAWKSKRNSALHLLSMKTV